MTVGSALSMLGALAIVLSFLPQIFLWRNGFKGAMYTILQVFSGYFLVHLGGGLHVSLSLAGATGRETVYQTNTVVDVFFIVAIVVMFIVSAFGYAMVELADNRDESNMLFRSFKLLHGRWKKPPTKQMERKAG
jgi:hypothetical protein